MTCWMSRRSPSSSSGTSASSASIASRACSRSRRSGASLPKAIEASMELVCRSRSETLTRRSSSTNCAALAAEGSAPGVGSAGDSLTGPNLLGEDLLHRRTLHVAGYLPFGGVPLRNREPVCDSELLGDRLHPFDELLEPGARGDRLTTLEVDQLARKPPADRSPEVFLEQTVRPSRQRLALVERPRDARDQRVAERRERARLRELRLGVADADLHGREREVRPNAPPELRVLTHRPGLIEEADVLLPLIIAAVRIRI